MARQREELFLVVSDTWMGIGQVYAINADQARRVIFLEVRAAHKRQGVSIDQFAAVAADAAPAYDTGGDLWEKLKLAERTALK